MLVPVLRFLAGMIGGGVMTAAACWLAFIVPYEGAGPRSFWYGVAAGVVLAVLVFVLLLVAAAYDGPPD